MDEVIAYIMMRINIFLLNKIFKQMTAESVFKIKMLNTESKRPQRRVATDMLLNDPP